MKIVTMTSQGQITLPAYLRRKYNFGSSNKVLVKEKNNQIVVEPVSDVMSLAGVLNKYAKKEKSIEQIIAMEKEAVLQSVVEKYKNKLKNEGNKLISIKI